MYCASRKSLSIVDRIVIAAFNIKVNMIVRCGDLLCATALTVRPDVRRLVKSCLA